MIIDPPVLGQFLETKQNKTKKIFNYFLFFILQKQPISLYKRREVREEGKEKAKMLRRHCALSKLLELCQIHSRYGKAESLTVVTLHIRTSRCTSTNLFIQCPVSQPVSGGGRI